MPTNGPQDADASNIGEWIFHLNVARRACHLYSLDHPATEPAKQKLIEETQRLPAKAMLLKVSDDGFELPGATLGDAAAGGDHMAKQLVQLGIVAVGIRPPLSPDSVVGLLGLLTGLTDYPTEEQRGQVLRTAAAIDGVDLVPIDVDWFVFSEGLAANLALEGGLWSDLVEKVSGGALMGKDGPVSPVEMADVVNRSNDPRRVIRVMAEGVVGLLDRAAADSALLDGLTLLAAVEKLMGRLRPEHQRHVVRLLLPSAESANPLRGRLVDVVPPDSLVDGAEAMLDAGAPVPQAVSKKVEAIAEPSSPGHGRGPARGPEVSVETRNRARKLKRRLTQFEEEEPQDLERGGTPYYQHPAVVRGCDDDRSREQLLDRLGDHDVRRHSDLVLRSVQVLWPDTELSARAADRLVRRYFDRLGLGEFSEAEAIAADLLVIADQSALDRMTGREGLAALLEAVSAWGKDHRTQVARIASRFGESLVPIILEDLENEEQMSRRRRLMEMIIAIGPPAIPHLHRALDDDRWFVVRNMLLLLRRLDDPGLASRLTGLIEHDDPRVVAEVVRALAKSADPRWLQVLHRLFLLEHPQSGKEAMAVVSQLRHPEVAGLLLRLLQKKKGAHLRDDDTLELINALGSFPQPEVVKEFERLASLSNWRYPFRLTPVWEAVARAAARHQQPDSDRVLRKIASLKDPSAEIARKLLAEREGTSS
jgi:hypothetical protein